MNEMDFKQMMEQRVRHMAEIKQLETQEFEKIIEKIRKSCEGFGSGAADKTIEFIKEIVQHYAEKLGYSELEILSAIENKRYYTAPNYYQAIHFPRLENVLIFENKEDADLMFKIGKFVCPFCKGISTDPTVCNCKNEKGKECGFISYGFFRTMGQGLRFTVKDWFLKNPFVYEIFMPVDLLENKGVKK